MPRWRAGAGKRRPERNWRQVVQGLIVEEEHLHEQNGTPATKCLSCFYIVTCLFPQEPIEHFAILGELQAS